MSHFNYYNVKRQAHSVSRASADHTWNPFRHVSWNQRANRADTWDVERSATNNNEDGGPVTHYQTAPTRTMPTEDSTADTMVQPPILDTKSGEKKSLDANGQSAGKPPAEIDSGLRNRRTEGEGSKPDSPVDKPEDEEDDKNKKKKVKQTGMIRHVQPKTPFTVANQLQRTFLNSWINVLIIAAPVGIALDHVNGIPPYVVFLVNFIAIIPLAAMLSFATEEIALRTGETLGGLLNASFGNAVELIVAIIALTHDEIQIVQTSLVGSILSNLLLVLGFCFFCGGLRRSEQFFNTTVAQTAASLLALAVASVIVPSVFEVAIKSPKTPEEIQGDVAKISRGTSVILLLVYAAYLFFQLKTHQDVFNEQSQKVAAKPWSMGPLSKDKQGMNISQGLAMPGSLLGHGMPNQNENERLSRMLMNPPRQNMHLDDDEDDEEEPQLQFFVAFLALGISTAIIAICAEAMVGSIDAVTAQTPALTKEFVGLILLPIVGNAAEHATAVTVAMKDKMDLAIGVAVGSSMQVALFLIPLLVIIGWGMDKVYMDLSFDLFQVAVLFVSVLLVNYLIADGKSHWLEGFLLICLYAIIAVCAFWYPPAPEHNPKTH